MDFAAIKQKYQSILSQDTPCYSDDQSDEEPHWVDLVQDHKDIYQGSRRPLGEVKENNQSTIQQKKGQKQLGRNKSHKNNGWLGNEQYHEQQLLQLKEKLAQSIANDSKKAERIKQLEMEIVSSEQRGHLAEKLTLELKEQIKEKENLLTEERVKYGCLQKENQRLEQRNTQMGIDRDLIQSQIEFYKGEIQSLKKEINQKNKNFSSLSKEFGKFDQLKKQNERLRDDIKRLFFLLSKDQVLSPLAIKLQGKHFLGKPSKHTKELEYWYPESLMSGVEQLLRKEQIGYGNKQFTENLCKFIYGVLQKSESAVNKKTKQKIKTHIKTLERRQNQVINVFDQFPSSSASRCTDLNRKLYSSSIKSKKAIKKSCRKIDQSLQCLNDSHIDLNFQKRFKTTGKNICTEDNDMTTVLRDQFTLQEHPNAEIGQKINSIKKVCFELIDCFKVGVDKLWGLEDHEKLVKKLKQLVQWLCSNMKESFRSCGGRGGGSIDRSRCHSLKNPAKWKTMEDF